MTRLHLYGLLAGAAAFALVWAYQAGRGDMLARHIKQSLDVGEAIDEAPIFDTHDPSSRRLLCRIAQLRDCPDLQRD